MIFDSVIVVDWSGGSDTGPAPRRDALWAAVASGEGVDDGRYFRNRDLASAWLRDHLACEVRQGRRCLACFDFPFAYPSGFARALTGDPDPLALWDYLSARLDDDPRGGNRFDLAGAFNRRLGPPGPFWFNALAREIPDLPRLKPRRDWSASPFAERRRVETLAPGIFTPWQMGGAGAVGSQAMTGMARLARLRAALCPDIAVWPFQPATAPVVLAEVWPSLLAAEVRELADPIRDRGQVRLLAAALHGMNLSGRLADALARSAEGPPDEGWILGVGALDALRDAARISRISP